MGFRHTPDLLLQELLFHGEPPVLLLAGFDHLLLVRQLVFLCHRLQLFLHAGAAQGVDAGLVAVELSQHQLQAVVVNLVHQSLVLLRLGGSKCEQAVAINLTHNYYMQKYKGSVEIHSVPIEMSVAPCLYIQQIFQFPFADIVTALGEYELF